MLHLMVPLSLLLSFLSIPASSSPNYLGFVLRLDELSLTRRGELILHSVSQVVFFLSIFSLDLCTLLTLSKNHVPWFSSSEISWAKYLFFCERISSFSSFYQLPPLVLHHISNILHAGLFPIWKLAHEKSIFFRIPHGVECCSGFSHWWMRMGFL